MKRKTTATLAAAIFAVGMGTMAVSPALAKKEDKAQSGGLQLSKEVQAPAAQAQTALQAKDWATAETAVNAIDAAAKTDDEKYVGALLRYALVSGKIQAASTTTNGAFDPTPMVGPLDALIANPKTPPAELPKFLYTRATIAYDAKQYPQAIDLFTRAQKAGSTEANLPLYLTKAKIQGGQAAGGLADLEAMANSGKPMTDDYYKYAIASAQKAGDRAATVKWLNRWVKAYPTSKTWRDALVFYGLQQASVAKLDKRQMIDLFRLMRQSKALADQNDYEEYAQKVFDVGLPEETKAVIAEGKAAGKIPTPANPNVTQLNNDAARAIAAEGSLAPLEKKAAAAPTGALSSQTADAYLGQGDYAKAIPLYKQALTKGGVDKDEVNMHLGIALALSGDKAGGKAAFQSVTATPRSEIAQFWQTWVDTPPTS
jgi:tetratricopeptide (TPR) repeat protein